MSRLGRDFDPKKAGPTSTIDIPASAAPVGGVVAAMDRLGGAVACALTQGPRFASGRLAGDTGIFVGPPPPKEGLVSLVPFIAADLANNRTVMAAASTGGVMAPTGAAQLALGALIEARGLAALLERPRMAHDGNSVLLEDFGGDSALALEDRGHKLKVLPQTGRINAVLCPGGLPSARPQCEARPDPRGRGLGVAGE
jgi:gamma-glutamyltranspeptidase/glutathione hydrolase